MNAKQIENKGNSKGDVNWALITVEKVERPSLWARFRESFSSSDMNLEAWERLEMKRRPTSFRSDEWRSF
jgi:hypothetical protein